MKEHSTYNIKNRTSNEMGVARASGLLFRVSRPKPFANERPLHRLLLVNGPAYSTKFGATPVPPATPLDLGC